MGEVVVEEKGTEGGRRGPWLTVSHRGRGHQKDNNRTGKADARDLTSVPCRPRGYRILSASFSSVETPRGFAHRIQVAPIREHGLVLFAF